MLKVPDCCYYFSHSAYWLPTQKTTLHGGQSRSWSAEQGKENKIKKVWQRTPPPPPPTLLVRRKKKKKITRRIYRRYAGLGPSRVRTRIPSIRRLGQGCFFAKSYASACDNKFPSLVASLFSWRCLAASISSFLRAAIKLRPPSVTVSTHTSAFIAVAFQSPYTSNARMLLCTQSVHSFSFPPRPLRTAPSRFPDTIRFGSRLPLVQESGFLSKPQSRGQLVQGWEMRNWPMRLISSVCLSGRG